MVDGQPATNAVFCGGTCLKGIRRRARRHLMAQPQMFNEVSRYVGIGQQADIEGNRSTCWQIDEAHRRQRTVGVAPVDDCLAAPPPPR